MLKTVLNTNIIPHIWKLANIVHIPKPNEDIDMGTSYRPISLLSVIAKTLEKSLLPYITANIPNPPTKHGYKTQHSTVMALHTVNNTVAKGFKQLAPHARTITVALDMNKAFDTINIHFVVVSTHSLDPCLWGESDHPAFGPPVSISLHMAINSITPARSVHKSRGDSVVRMWVQLKRWCMCGCCREGIVVMDVIWRRLCVSMI